MPGAVNDKVKIGLIFGATAAVLAGGALYFFGVHQPRARVTAAQDEIAAWEGSYDAARRCLLGSPPASPSTAEALAVRELAPDPWERKTCTSLIARLTRSAGVDTELAAVEAAWADVDARAGKVALAFAKHVDARAARPGTYDPAALPQALDDLDAAYAALRRAASLPVAAPEGPRLPAATMIALAHDDKPLEPMTRTPVTHRAGLHGRAVGASGELQIQLVAGREPSISTIEDGVLRAIPDASWGARGADGAVEIGAVDAGGALAEPARLPVTPSREIPTVYAAVGGAADGAVVYGARDGRLWIARGGAGRPFVAKPLAAAVAGVVHAVDADTGHAVIVYADASRALFALALAPGQLDAAPEPLQRTGAPRRLCLDGDSAWLQYDDEDGAALVDFVPGGARVDHDTEDFSLERCSVDGAVLWGGARSTFLYRHCAAECRDFKVDPSSLVIASRGWAAIRARGGVLEVKREGGARHFAITAGFTPVVAISDGKLIDVLGRTRDGLAIARVPAE